MFQEFQTHLAERLINDPLIELLTNPNKVEIVLARVLPVSKTDVYDFTHTTYQDVPGLSQAITPRSVNSIIAIHIDTHIGSVGITNFVNGLLLRDSTPIGIGDAAGSRDRCTFSVFPDNANSSYPVSRWVFDSPNTESEVTYKIQVRAFTGLSTKINAGGVDPDSANHPRLASTLTLIELLPRLAT